METFQAQPARPRPSATVILTRQQGAELQVYLLKRNIKSRFMAGNYVFPGGIVEPEDGDVDRWMANIDLDLNELNQRLGDGLSAPESLAYGIAAIRETYEEAGIILADRSGRTSEDVPQLARRPLSGQDPGGAFLRQVQSENWVLKLSDLGSWSRWVTPERMTRRYDTRFFLATMPPGQVCRPDQAETVHGFWISPQKGLAANLRGEVPLSPPTLVTLHELLKYANLDALEGHLKHRPWGEMRLPRLEVNNDAAVIVQPWDHQYRQAHISVDTDALPGAVLPVGEPFSRLWHCGGIWKPVRG